ncbi:hypothetical protein ROHU_027084 [Labeo rohita]|uniref:Uncharacterized protein n=1 Tax=Labeo rohita TaxID=84645 RepID=A0A498MCI4_LABRO|nr:hypothetical protein ROHU_027084 [Labeo rohita]
MLPGNKQGFYHISSSDSETAFRRSLSFFGTASGRRSPQQFSAGAAVHGPVSYIVIDLLFDFSANLQYSRLDALTANAAPHTSTQFGVPYRTRPLPSSPCFL